MTDREIRRAVERESRQSADNPPYAPDDNEAHNQPNRTDETEIYPPYIPNPRGGPRTLQGKAKSSLNNLHHGLTGSFRIVGNESQRDFDSLLATLTGEHQPATATELILVERIAEHLWLGRRAQRLQDVALIEDNLHRLAIYTRYATTNHRAFHNSLAELSRVQKERRKRSGPAQPGSPEFESQKARELEQKRVEEWHVTRVRLANARAETLELGAQKRKRSVPPAQNTPETQMKEAHASHTHCSIGNNADLDRENIA